MPIVIDGPHELDGKMVLVSSPSTEGLMTWITSRGDDLVTPARGGGQQLAFAVSAPGTYSVDLEFMEPVELHDGQFTWHNPGVDWTQGDEFSLSVIMPATPLVANPGAGNCNLFPAGGYNVIVPAAGDGSHDMDPKTAVPVPASGAGYWDVQERFGVTASDVTPSASPGTADWHLIDVPAQSYFLRNICMGNPLGIFDVDVYKAEWISQRWKLRVDLVRNTVAVGSFKASGWLMMFRESST